jgi:hypothetical protein
VREKEVDSVFGLFDIFDYARVEFDLLLQKLRPPTLVLLVEEQHWIYLLRFYS